MKRVLVFPGGVAAAEQFRQKAIQSGMSLVGASSNQQDSAASLYEHWVCLPNIHDPAFPERLRRAVKDFGIEEIFCGHAIVYQGLQNLLAQGRDKFNLINPPPESDALGAVQTLMERAQKLHVFAQTVCALPLPLKTHEVAGLLHVHDAIPGESAEDKIGGMIAAAAQCVKGDIVEIGALWGRSAALFACLSRRFGIGPVLIVDPWQAQFSVQHDAPELVQQSTHRYDWNTIFQGFLLHTAPYATPGEFNYLRLPSVEAAGQYEKHSKISSDEFGATTYQGRIGLLHIDGNHDEAAVTADVAAWLPHMSPGGWIILDDYVWLHGEGVKRTGDKLMAEQKNRINQAFVAGKALFMQWQ